MSCRCLLRDLGTGDEAHAKVIRFYDEQPEHLRVSRETFDARLDRCRECRHLRNGNCMQCGCYVEVRAALRKSACPMKYWI